MAFPQLFETDEQEAARLAQAPATSRNGLLALLPVTMREWPEGFVLRLPKLDDEDSMMAMTVVPVTYHRGYREPGKAEALPFRDDGSWDCIVVASEHPSYPVGGYRVSISCAELRRSTRLSPESLTALGTAQAAG